METQPVSVFLYNIQIKEMRLLRKRIHAEVYRRNCYRKGIRRVVGLRNLMQAQK